MNKSFLMQLMIFAVAMLSASCGSISHNVMLGDVLSFSEDVNTNYTIVGMHQSDPYVIHSDKVEYDSKEVMNLKKQIKNAPSGVNTSLTYAQDLGLERIKYIRKHQLKRDKLAKYYTFILTDGLDNTSVEVAKNNKKGNYKNLEAYHKKIQKKIKTLMGQGKEQNLYQIYPMLQIGSDLEEFHQEQMSELSSEEFADFCRRNYMEPYRGSSKGYEKPEAIVAYSFSEIKERIAELFSSAAFEFFVPKGYAGKRIKMDLIDEQGQKASFEGDVVKKGNKFYIKKIEFKDGLSVKTSKKVKNIELTATNNSDKKDIRAWFRLENLQLGGKSYKVVPKQVKQSYVTYLEGKKYYQSNSEYKGDARPQVDTYFQFIFDTSGSIGENVQDEQAVLFDILEMITRDLKKSK